MPAVIVSTVVVLRMVSVPLWVVKVAPGEKRAGAVSQGRKADGPKAGSRAGVAATDR